MEKVKNPSLYFNWLPNNLRKGLPDVDLYFEDNLPYGGCYRKIQDFDNGVLNLTRRASIHIDTTYPEEIETTIAHEFRHHWQLYNIGPHKPSTWSNSYTSYEEAIIKYFSNDPFEMDALLFQRKHSTSDVVEEWFDYLLGEAYEDCRSRI